MAQIVKSLLYWWSMIESEFMWRHTDYYKIKDKLYSHTKTLETYNGSAHYYEKHDSNLYGEYVFMASILQAMNPGKKLDSRGYNGPFELTKEVLREDPFCKIEFIILAHNKSYRWHCDESKSDNVSLSEECNTREIKLSILEDTEIMKADNALSKEYNKLEIKLSVPEDTEIIKSDNDNIYKKWKSDIKDKRKYYDKAYDKYFGSTKLTADSIRKNCREENYINKLAEDVKDLVNNMDKYIITNQQYIPSLTEEITGNLNFDDVLKIYDDESNFVGRKCVPSAHDVEVAVYGRGISTGDYSFEDVSKLYNEKRHYIMRFIAGDYVSCVDVVKMFFWILVRPYHWRRFFDIKNLMPLKKIHDYKKAKNNSENVGPQHASLIGKIENDQQKVSNIKKSETKIDIDTIDTLEK